MRIAAFIGAILVANLITIGVIVLLALSSPEHIQSLVWLPIVALMVFVYGPLLLGSLISYWDVKASPAGWRYFRWWFIVSYALQVFGAVAIVVFAVLAAAPLWLPVVFVGAAALLNMLALRVGPALRRREDSRRGPDQPWQPITRESIARRILIIAGVFAIVLILGFVGFSLLFSLTDADHHGIGIGLMFAAEFAFMAAALTCILVSISLNRMIREQVSRDAGQVRKVAKVVLRGKPIALQAEEKIAAAKYAVVISVSLPFTLAYLALLYMAMGIQQLEQLSTQPDRVFSKVFLAFVVVVLVVLLPLYLVRIRRARAYARVHAQELPPSGRVGGETGEPQF